MTTSSTPLAHQIITETSIVHHKRTHAVTMATPALTSTTTAAVEIKSEFPPLSRIQIILIVIFSLVVLLLLFCTIVYQIYKRIKAKQQQKMATAAAAAAGDENDTRYNAMAVGGQQQHRSTTRPIMYNMCTDANSTAFLNPSVSTTFTVSSSQSTSRFQEYFLT